VSDVSDPDTYLLERHDTLLLALEGLADRATASWGLSYTAGPAGPYFRMSSGI
jgi:hypothetical protein